MIRSLACRWFVLSLMAVGCTRLLIAAETRPNFVLCMADDQGWGDVAYNGHPTIQTPNLDAMAGAALRMDHFYAAAPVCSPTRGSVMTGRHPNRFGCFKWGYTLRPEEITIAEALRDAGYTTGHFGKWHLGSVRASSPVSPGRSGFDQWLSSPNFYENDPWMSRNGKAVQTEGESSRVAMDAAIEFIRGAAKREQPFLAVVWFGSPHVPHIASEEIRKRYPNERPALQNYLGEITGIDLAMGQLRDELRQLGLADNTLVWYTSDNGAQGVGSTGGLRGKKGSVWEGGLRVPAILEWPATIREPRVSDLPASTVDIYPTLVSLAGAKVKGQPEPLDGMSLVPLIEGSLSERTKPLGFWDYPAPGQPVRSSQLLAELAKEQASGAESEATLPESAKYEKQYPLDSFPGHAAWRDGRFKLHRIASNKGQQPRFELYDLVADREESRDLAADQPERVATMSRALEAWQQSVVRSLNGEDYEQ